MPNLLPILYKDDALVAVDKPAGLAVHRGWAKETEVALTLVRDALNRYVYPVHRLDSPTSGVLLFALSPDIARVLCESFATALVRKSYVALVRGIPPAEGRIDYPLPPGEDRHAARVSAVTEFDRTATFSLPFGQYSLVMARPLSGRLHQIRRHLKHIACPIIGDVNYGKGEHNRIFREQFGLHRLFLHATRLRLPHPETGRWIEIHSPLPHELAATIERLSALESQPNLEK